MRITSLQACCMLAFIGLPLRAGAQTGLVTPDWSAPQVQRYLSTGAKPSRFDSSAGAATRDAKLYSLPVLGLVRDFHNPSPTGPLRDSFLNPTLSIANEAWWPKCAAKDAVETPADDNTGNWYVYNYDFGCIHISITGDRNSETVVPPELRDELADRRADDKFHPDDEKNDPNTVLSISADIKRFNVPYIVHISCTEEGKALCQDAKAQAALLSRLSIVAGIPRDATP
jgi:hypothetical protein